MEPYSRPNAGCTIILSLGLAVSAAAGLAIALINWMSAQ